MRNPITPRLREIWQDTASGLTAKEIAAARHIAVSTVQDHQSKLHRRLKARNAVGLCLLAIAHGVIPAPAPLHRPA